MLNYLLEKIELTTCGSGTKSLAGLALLCGLALATLTGCETAPGLPPSKATAMAVTNSPESLVLHEGDTLKISFPGAPNLDTTESVRRDGKITLSLVGEYDALGKTPAQVETDLKKLYASQLVNSEVSVTVQSSAFVVFVMGAVTKPGELTSDRVLTPLEALIQSGIDDNRSNLKAVQVIRTDKNGHTVKYKLNLSRPLTKAGAQMPSFTLQPYDIIRVPERFSFF